MLLVTAESRLWRRQWGALAWAALEELALSAHRDGKGWVAPVGVRHIARGIGTTKDTAARALAALGAAGVVVLERVEGLDGGRRSGYRLHPPAGIQIHRCPSDRDSTGEPVARLEIPDTRSCPSDQDNSADNRTSPRCPADQEQRSRPHAADSLPDTRTTSPPALQPRRGRAQRPRSDTTPAEPHHQPGLFDSDAADQDRAAP